MAAPPPDYYGVLQVDPSATQQEIREAYKKQALQHHPDRVPADSPERPARTKKFQQINDAYFTLSDPNRRRDYDTARQFHGEDDEYDDADVPPSGGRGFSWSSFGFGRGGSGTQEQEDATSEAQFESVFEEMMREEGMAEGERASPTSKFWSIVGGLSGATMGFIVANMPGALAGAVAGNRLGAVRDAKGKSVYAVFQELPQGDKARLLSQLAAKVFSHAVSG